MDSYKKYQLSYMFRRLLCHLQGERFLYAENYCYVLWLHRFVTFIQLLRGFLSNCVKVANLCKHKSNNSFEHPKISPWRWRSNRRNMWESVDNNTYIALYMCICWCIKYIIYEKMHGMESFKISWYFSCIRVNSFRGETGKTCLTVTTFSDEIQICS
jgi:hypothetical protein